MVSAGSPPAILIRLASLAWGTATKASALSDCFAAWPYGSAEATQSAIDNYAITIQLATSSFDKCEQQ